MNTVDYATFDLYDTAVVRHHASEITVFELTWKELSSLHINFPKLEAYVRDRQEAQRHSGVIDAPSLSKILEFLPDIYRPFLADIESLESKLEMRQLSVAPSIIKYIAGLRKKNIKIAFISDMHIGAKHLQPTIESLGLYKKGDIVLVSSDVGCSKSRQGKLFRYFLNHNNLSAKHIVHHGNSFWSDVKMARKHGIAPRFIPELNPNRFEVLIKKEIADRGIRKQLMSGSKKTRIEAYEKFDTSLFDQPRRHDKTLINIASSVAGPVLYFFVLWAIKQCRQRSITRIRFLTRDGEILKAIADELPSDLTEGLDIQLLEVSRNSIVLPTASVVPIEDWIQAGLQPNSYLVQHHDRLPAQHVFQRAGLCVEKNSDVLSEFGLTDGNTPLGDEGLEKWKLALASAQVHEIIRRSSEERLHAVSAYLQQNIGSPSAGEVALVDVGWTGQQAAMLGALIQQTVKVKSLHLLVGRLKRFPLLTDANIEGWLFDETANRPSPTSNPVALFESFLATLSGGVQAYEQAAEGHWIAKRRSQHHTNALSDWGQKIVRECLVNYAKNSEENQLSSSDQLALSEILLKEFWCNPSVEEAIHWGKFPYEQDQTGKSVATLAREYQVKSLCRKLVGIKHEIDWKAGSLAISAAPIREMIKIFEFLKSRRKS